MSENRKIFSEVLNSISNYSWAELYEKIKDLGLTDDYIYHYLMARCIYRLRIDNAKAVEHIRLCIDLIEKTRTIQIEDNADLLNLPFEHIPYDKIYFFAGKLYALIGKQDESLECYQKFQYWNEQVKNEELCEKENIVVYSFRRFNEYSLSDLINNEITVCHPSVMNDPFDSIANLWSSEKNLDSICIHKEHISSYSKSFQYFRIRSFAANRKTYETDDEILKKILMWSFYAGEHKGFCVKYRLSKHFIKQEKNTEHCILRMVPVSYEESFSLEGKDSLTTSNSYALKNKAWEYEDEVRLLSYNTNSESKYLGIALSDDKSNNSKIEEIIFGLLCPNEHKKVIKNIVKGYPYKIKIREIYRTDKNIYDLCIRDVDETL